MIYAQKNPLIVYKEKAFYKFEELIWEIEYKTTKAIFSVKTNIEIKQIEFNEKAFIVTTDEESINITQNGSTNPLFAQPQSNTKSSWSGDKKKIRV